MSTEDGYATVEDLTTDRVQVAGEDYVLEETGHRVRIRPLSRREVLQGQHLRDTGLVQMEAHMIRCAMVIPKLRDVDVLAWMDATPAGDLEPLTRRINQISALDRGSDTAAYEQFRQGSGDGVRPLPGAEAIDDGSRPEGPAD